MRIIKKLNRAIFLDRDGVINLDRPDYVKSVSELKIIDGVFDAIKKLNDANFMVIIISNQSAINRGKTTRKNVEEINELILRKCKENSCKIDAIYFCPHRPDENCDCRKPKPGLILKAISEHKIDLNSSWLIGDKETDILAGRATGCKTIRIATNGSLRLAVEELLE